MRTGLIDLPRTPRKTGRLLIAPSLRCGAFDSPGNPVLSVGPAGGFDDRFASDPCVLRHGDTWIMFYYGLSSDGHARDGGAVSTDLRHWTKLGEALIDVGPDGSIDSRYAHKPGVITKARTLHHFHCAVAPAADPRQGEIEHGEVRGISCACS